MNIFLLIFTFFIALPSAFPCKPSPLPSCKGERIITLETHSLEKLRKIVSQFQKLLGDSIPADSAKDSCFNNQFASYYLISMTGPETCGKQISIVDSSVSTLINPSTQEWKSIESESAIIRLKKVADEVKIILSHFLKNHRAQN